MIVFERAYKASDGKCYATLEEAKLVEIQRMIQNDPMFPGGLENIAAWPALCEVIVKRSPDIVNILTLTDSSRPKARGAKKPRKSKAPEFPMKDEP